MFDGMKSIRRRACLKNSLAASVISDAAIGQGRGANDRVQIAIIGCGGRGAQITSSLVRQSNVLCSQVWDIRESGLSVLLII